MKLYSITPDYPVNRLAIRVDGQEVPFETRNLEPHWNQITTAAFASPCKTMRLEVISPYTVPVEYINPSSKDRRRLSLAVSNISFSASE